MDRIAAKLRYVKGLKEYASKGMADGLRKKYGQPPLPEAPESPADAEVRKMVEEEEFDPEAAKAVVAKRIKAAPPAVDSAVAPANTDAQDRVAMLEDGTDPEDADKMLAIRHQTPATSFAPPRAPLMQRVFAPPTTPSAHGFSKPSGRPVVPDSGQTPPEEGLDARADTSGDLQAILDEYERKTK